MVNNNNNKRETTSTMPTASQCKILSKIGVTPSARVFSLQKVSEESDGPVYVPPVRKVFHCGKGEVRAPPSASEDGDGTFFPEMVSMATLLAKPGKNAEEMSADEIMKRLQELGWRKEGDAVRYADEKRRRYRRCKDRGTG